MKHKTKPWCEHIDWDSDNFDHHHYYWQYNDDEIQSVLAVPTIWKVCPVCLTKRPGKTKVDKALEDPRFRIDNDL